MDHIVEGKRGRDGSLTRPPVAPINSVLERNIEAMRRRQLVDEEQKSVADRLADRISSFAGSMPFVYMHAAIVIAWVVINLGWIKGVPKFDDSLVILATAASVEAIFLSTFILISQNREAKVAHRRAELDVHISLLAEHEVTKLIQITSAIAGRLGVEIPREHEVEELKGDVAPDSVLNKIEETEAEKAHS